MTGPEQSKTVKRVGGGGHTPLKHVVVLGVGNVLLSDEGVGVHVANKLMEMDLPPGIEVVEGGTYGFGLINVVTEADRLIVVDAVKGGGPAGSIYRFDLKDAPTYPDMDKTSVHQISILEVIRLSELVGQTPETTIIGVEPKSVAIGLQLSPVVEDRLTRIVELVL